jgi:hypothetical protein
VFICVCVQCYHYDMHPYTYNKLSHTENNNAHADALHRPTHLQHVLLHARPYNPCHKCTHVHVNRHVFHACIRVVILYAHIHCVCAYSLCMCVGLPAKHISSGARGMAHMHIYMREYRQTSAAIAGQVNQSHA